MLKAVLFDQDGVIIDTERHGHRVAFNQAFARLGHGDVDWDGDLYHELLQVGGGKERIRYYFENRYNGANRPADIGAFAAEMHKVKTDIFLGLLPALPLRPGVRRFMKQVAAMGLKMAICTTSHERAAKTVAEKILADIPFEFVIAGDMVKKKKPDPEIYLNALARLGMAGRECLVVEDSNIGVAAAKAAGCYVLATYNDYTESEDLSRADFIVSCLGDRDGEHAVEKKALFPIVADGEVAAEMVKKL